MPEDDNLNLIITRLDNLLEEISELKRECLVNKEIISKVFEKQNNAEVNTYQSRGSYKTDIGRAQGTIQVGHSYQNQELESYTHSQESTCVEFSDKEMDHIGSIIVEDQDTSKNKVKMHPPPQESSISSNLEDHNGMISLFESQDQELILDLDAPIRENKDINIILRLNKRQIINLNLFLNFNEVIESSKTQKSNEPKFDEACEINTYSKKEKDLQYKLLLKTLKNLMNSKNNLWKS